MIGDFLKKLILLAGIVFVFGAIGLIETANKISQGTFIPSDVIQMFGDALNNGFAQVPRAVMSLWPSIEQHAMGTFLMNVFMIGMLWAFIYLLLGMFTSKMSDNYSFRWKMLTALIALLIVLGFGFIASPFISPVNASINLSANISGAIVQGMTNL